jgi:hypothetical protein
MRVVHVVLVGSLLGLAACFEEPPELDPNPGPQADPCVDFIVDDPLLEADPPDVFPGDAFTLRWFER